MRLYVCVCVVGSMWLAVCLCVCVFCVCVCGRVCANAYQTMPAPPPTWVVEVEASPEVSPHMEGGVWFVCVCV